MDNFERLMALAEFAAKRHEERRQVEFKIFITYLTFLAVIFYHFTKKEGLSASIDAWVREVITRLGLSAPSSSDLIDAWVLIVALLLIHVVYFFWQTTIGMANDNDTNRRNFFLIRAECIAHYFIQNPTKETFSPSDQKKVLVKRDGKDCKIRETELFAEQHPEITLPPYSMGRGIKYSHKFWKDWFRGSQFAIPTIMLGTLFLIKLDSWWQGLLALVPLAILSLIFPFVSFCLSKKERNDN